MLTVKNDITDSSHPFLEGGFLEVTGGMINSRNDSQVSLADRVLFQRQ